MTASADGRAPLDCAYCGRRAGRVSHGKPVCANSQPCERAHNEWQRAMALTKLLAVDHLAKRVGPRSWLLYQPKPTKGG